MNENELMSSLPVPKAVAKMAIPSVISSLVTVVYNMADTFLSDRPEIRCRWRRSASCLRQTCLSHFLQMGLANGVQPLLGYNYGSGDHKRFVSVERYTKKMLCHCRHFSYGAVFLFYGEPIIRLFISDGEVVYYGVKMLIATCFPGRSQGCYLSI